MIPVIPLPEPFRRVDHEAVYTSAQLRQHEQAVRAAIATEIGAMVLPNPRGYEGSSSLAIDRLLQAIRTRAASIALGV